MSKINKIEIKLVVLMLIFCFSCVNDTEEDLLEPVIPVSVVTYDNEIKPIFDSNCIFCHTNPPVNGASTSLNTFETVKFGVENLNVINRISAQPGEAGFMPLSGARLPQQAIDLIIEWQNSDFTESVPN